MDTALTKNTAENQWTKAERLQLLRLNSPVKIQRFLDSLTFRGSEKTRSPREVMRDRSCRCIDGAIFAAAALEFHQQPPLLLDLRASQDCDHVISVFQSHGCYGAIAMSEFSGLRFREPIYRTTRELALSYFELYFNLRRQKTLREYSALFHLSRCDDLNWRYSEAGLEEVAVRLDASRHYSLVRTKALGNLSLVDKNLFSSTKYPVPAPSRAA